MSRNTRPQQSPSSSPAQASMRLDKWLWAARFFKTRGLAAEAVDRGRITINGQLAKRAKDIRIGDLVEWRRPSREGPAITLSVLAISASRGPAPTAQAMYAETETSQQARLLWQQQAQLASAPTSTVATGRPTKKGRRQLTDWQQSYTHEDRPCPGDEALRSLTENVSPGLNRD